MDTMTNIGEELLEHFKDIGNPTISYWSMKYVDSDSDRPVMTFKDAGYIDEPLFSTLVHINYNSGYGTQHLFGYVVYEDGTWSERVEYDGMESWVHRVCPDIDTPVYT
jgi:hypothetical protein